jgi:hypothetical protein
MAAVYWIHLPEHTDFTSQGYIGFTSKKVSHRFRQHKNDAYREKCKHFPIYRAIRKYGELIVVDTLVEGSNEYCLMIEQKLRPTVKIGWNTQRGGEKGNLGMKSSEETRNKISVSGKGLLRTAETKANISNSLKGRKKSPEHCRAVSEARKRLGISPWEQNNANLYVWSLAEQIRSLLLQEVQISKIESGFNINRGSTQALVRHIRNGWEPEKDAKWVAFKTHYENKG